MSKPNPAVVFTHYNCPGGDIPELRLQEQLAWNESYYRQSGCRVYVVTDRPRVLPEYAVSLIPPFFCFPRRDGRIVFSQAKTKNMGIAAALADGMDPIVVCDTDIQFTHKSWERLLLVDERTVVVPLCIMRTWHDRSDPQDHPDIGCTGTVSMRAANWERFRYDESYVGYGGEDGELIYRLTAAGLDCDRETRIHHIAHVLGENPRRTPGSGHATCYNRATGFNPDNFAINANVQ